MSRVLCEEQQKLLLSLKKSLTLRDKIDIDNTPPRKLLTRRQPAADMFSDEDPYSSDQFRMYEFKIRRCTRSRSHDWTDCPFAHPGEKARRRDPLKYQYSGEVCPDYRRGNCERGDACEFSHGVFECWLHPSRYRTEACKDGKNCKRKICFFAHTPRQLRVLLLTPPQNNSNNNNNNNNNKKSHNNNNCCSYCHCCSANSSPTSTLFSGSHFSKSNSPPLSPSSSSSSPTTLSRYSKNMHVLNELMRSIELESTLNSPVSATKLPWLDVNVSDQYSPFGCEDHSQNHVIDVSPTMNCGKYYSCDDAEFSREQRKVVGDDDVIAVPDFGWVNDLLM